MGSLNVTGKSLCDLLLDQVRSQPDHHAIIHDDARISYGELWQRIMKAAKRLRERGVDQGDRVVMLMDNSVHYVVAYYAIMYLEAVSVPLNTGLKGQQLGQIISHAQSSVVLHDGSHAAVKALEPQLEEASATALNIATSDLSDGELLCPDSTPEKSRASDGQLNTIIYTSGTTGRPKGVMLSGKNLLSNTLAIIEYLGLSSDDRMMCVLPFYYAYGNSILHTHLAAGATIILENSLMYPGPVLERMATEKVTGFAGVPSTFRLLLLRCDLSQFPLPDLRYLTQAGGAMAAEDIQRVVDYWPSAQFFAMYGQTEATARLTYLPPDRLADKAASVGRPVAGVRIKVIDEHGREVPRGVTGEICATGPNIMLGYWQDPVASETKLMGQWLRTGDLGFRDEEGFITIVGRSTDMIKTGDHRVAPEEVEQVIAAMESVEEVGVVGAPDTLLGQVLKAYVVLSPDSRLEKRDIMRHCKQQCAHYKMPREIQFVTALPKTASGKVQRYKLLEMDNFTENCV